LDKEEVFTITTLTNKSSIRAKIKKRAVNALVYDILLNLIT